MVNLKEEIKKVDNEKDLDDLLTEIYKKKRQNMWVWWWWFIWKK